MKSRSRQTEVMTRTNRMRAALNLASHPDFGEDYGEWTPGGNPAGYFTYCHLGYEIRLRFSQETHEWTATAPHFNIETSFPNQPPQDIQQLLNTWLTDHLATIAATANDRWRMSLPAVQSLANQHGVSQVEALEIYKMRGE